MRKYHLSCGDSTRGPVGLSGSVVAPNRKKAILLFRRTLQNAAGPFGEVPIRTDHPGVEYINVYVEPSNIQIQEIDLEG